MLILALLKSSFLLILGYEYFKFGRICKNQLASNFCKALVFTALVVLIFSGEIIKSKVI